MFKTLDKKPNIYVPLLMILMAASPLAGAYISEFGFGYAPCPLCLYQRVPYAIIVVISIMMLLLGTRTRLPRFLFLCAVLYIIDSGIAGYHTGVEQGWWAGLEGCSDDIVADTIEELRAKLSGVPIARCDEPALVVLGLSMAAWNMLYALGAGIFSFMLLGRYIRD